MSNAEYFRSSWMDKIHKLSVGYLLANSIIYKKLVKIILANSNAASTSKQQDDQKQQSKTNFFFGIHEKGKGQRGNQCF